MACIRIAIAGLLAAVVLAGAAAAVAVIRTLPRPASERIPAAVTRLTVTVLDQKQVVQGPFTFTAHTKVQRVRGLLNGLPRFPAGAFACPADFGVIVRLKFYDRAGRVPLAVARADPGGCESVELTIRGRRQPELTSMALPGSGRSQRVSLVDQLDRALGVKLKTVPAA